MIWLCLRVRTVRLFLVIVIAVGATRCARDPLSEAIAAAVAQGRGTRLALAELERSNWDNVCVFGPYTSDDDVDAVTGIAGASKHAFDIKSNDGINVLLFIERGRVTTSVAHPRGRGDFGPELVRKCYSKAEAVFMVREPSAGMSGNIGPLP